MNFFWGCSISGFAPLLHKKNTRIVGGCKGGSGKGILRARASAQLTAPPVSVIKKAQFGKEMNTNRGGK
jgi:hypothetical protein